MNIQEAASALDGCQYREENKAISFAELKGAGLVAVYGASDDLIQFGGAINDEAGCYDGGVIYITAKGPLEGPDCDCDAARKLHQIEKAQAAKIKAIWSPPALDCSWAYETKIPHASFRVMEGIDLYCIGFVFHISSLQNEATQ